MAIETCTDLGRVLFLFGFLAAITGLVVLLLSLAMCRHVAARSREHTDALARAHAMTCAILSSPKGRGGTRDLAPTSTQD